MPLTYRRRLVKICPRRGGMLRVRERKRSARKLQEETRRDSKLVTDPSKNRSRSLSRGR